MARVLTFEPYAVYVFDERDQPHHLPHAHIKLRGKKVCSVFLYTLAFFDQQERLPAGLVQLIKERQEFLLAEWERLNND